MQCKKEERVNVDTSYPKHLFYMANSKLTLSIQFILNTEVEANLIKKEFEKTILEFDTIVYCPEHNFWECSFLSDSFANSYYQRACRALNVSSVAFVVDLAD